jgi:hypothetical protein
MHAIGSCGRAALHSSTHSPVPRPNVNEPRLASQLPTLPTPAGAVIPREEVAMVGRVVLSIHHHSDPEHPGC